MVQRKVPSKLGILADHVKSGKLLENLKTSSQLQDGKIRGADMKKKMKKSRSIKLSDLKALQSSPPKKSLSQPAYGSPQKQQSLSKTADGSPNYMKPTSSSCAKKELFPVSLRNTEMGSDFKSQRPEIMSNLRTSSVSGKKPAKTLSRSSSLKLVRTLMKTHSFKPARACPRKSSRVALCADMDARKATCSSTLKNSKFPAYLMLSPGGTESEGTSAMKVCPYTYCSLNGHRHAPLPPLKSFLSARRRVLKTQKCLKLEALSPRKLKVPRETKKESEIDQNVFDGKPAYHEADTANSTVIPLVQEIGMDFFIEIYAKENEFEAKPAGAEPNGKKFGEISFSHELKNQDDSMPVRGDDDIKQVVASVPDGSPKSEINFEEDFTKYYDDVAVEADSSEIILEERKAEYVDGDSPPNCPNEEVSLGRCYSEISFEGEHYDGIEMDCSNSEATDMDWEERQFCSSEHEEDAVSSVFSEEGADSKVEYLSESSHDDSVMWLDDILCNYYDVTEESTCFNALARGDGSDLEGTRESTETPESGYSSNDINWDQSSLTEEAFQDWTNGEENGGENEACGDTETFPSDFMEKTTEELEENSKENQENDDVLQTEILMTKTSPELGDDENNCITKVLDKTLDNGQEGMFLQDDATCKSVGDSGEEKGPLTADTDDRMEKEGEADVSNGKDFSQDSNEADIVGNNQDHKMSEACEIEESREERNSIQESNDRSISQEMVVQDQELLQNDQGKTEKHERSSCIDVEDHNTSRIWKGVGRKKLVEDDEEMRKFNPREPNFLPLVPDPEAEKVDLKHQMMDERKNAEEWMLDYALRQTVTKLAPARKRKVALLVEAFEKVMPPHKYGTHIRKNSAFPNGRPMQACR